MTQSAILSPLARYEQLLASAKLSPDEAQRALILRLEKLYQTLLDAPTKGIKRLLKPARAPAGLYIYGEVGRGKTMAMDVFAAAISPHFSTRRVHFHAFMLDVHKRLHAFRSLNVRADSMPQLIDELAAEQRILCLDEFQVHDVADAAILSRLFGGLLEAGVCVIFTSNRKPHDLYQGGLQRELFLKFVDEVIVARMEIVSLQSPHDYRLQQLQALQKTFYYPRNLESDEALLTSWQALTGGAPSQALNIEVQGRILRIDKHAQGVAWLTFPELCMRPLGASDYLELTRMIHTLILQGIPALTPEQRNEAKRFVTLIDTLYDHRIKCIFSAETPPEGIYAKGDGSFEFARTVSRLTEMQSANYLAGGKL